MPDPLLRQLANITSVEAAEEMILTLAEEVLKATDNQRRKNLREVRKLVEVTIRDRLLPAVAFDAALDELQSVWSRVAGHLLPYAPTEVQERCGELVRTLFDGIREDLRSR